jgi:hydroxymethylpyrimidine/phosphomethylpyrimidine kinase
MTIAGSDSGGGAGIQADLKTFHSLGVFGTSAITCLTAQNPASITAVEAISASVVRAQMNQIADYFSIRAIKTGMLFNNEIILAVTDFLKSRPEIKVIVDPVMVATSGAVLLEETAIQAMTENLFPQACLITPNLDEAAVLLCQRPESRESMVEAALQLASKFQTAVLLKGGHMQGLTLIDILAFPNGKKKSFEQIKNPSIHTHGSGCTLASAIAAYLAHGHEMEPAVESALSYLQDGIRNPVVIDGQSYIQHHHRP